MLLALEFSYADPLESRSERIPGEGGSGGSQAARGTVYRGDEILVEGHLYRPHRHLPRGHHGTITSRIAMMIHRVGGDVNDFGEAIAPGSPGIDELRWLKPVRPGDTLSLRMTILESVPSRTKPDRGLVRSLMEMPNQHGEVVLTIRGLSLLGRRPA